MPDDKKISELPLATTPLAGTEELEIVQGGVNKRVASSNIGGGGSVASVTGDGVGGTATNPVLTFPVASEVDFTPAGSIAATDVQAAIEELDTEKAPLASPTFTGVPAAPTPAANTSTTQLATTAFVQNSKYVFYVNDFGAVADSDGTTGNGTDNATALSNAFDAAVSAGGGTVRLGTGIYRYTGVLNKTGGNITVEGNGRGVSTLFCDNTTTNLTGLSVGGNDVHYTKFTFKGRKTFQSLGAGVRISGDNCSVINIEVAEANQFSIVASGATNSVIAGNHVRNGAADGIHAYGGGYLNIYGNTIHDMADDAIGIGFEGGINNVNVFGNTTFRTSSGVAVMGFSSSGSSVNVYNINVSNNNITETWLAGIFCHVTQGSLQGVNIIGNTIRSFGLLVPTADIPMRGDGVAAGISLQGATATTGHLLNSINISNNVLINGRNNFIDIGFVTASIATVGQLRNIWVTGNKMTGITNAGGQGAWGFGASGNSRTPEDVTYPGIAVKNTLGGLIVEGNFIRDPWGAIITVNSTVGGNVKVVDNLGELGNSLTTITFAYNVVPAGTSPRIDYRNNLYTDSDYTTGIHNVIGTLAGPGLIESEFLNSYRSGSASTTVNVTASMVRRTLGLTATGARTVNLPAANTFPVGIPFYVKDEAGAASTGNITIDATGAETIDGAGTFVMSTDYGSAGFYTNGTNWFTV